MNKRKPDDEFAQIDLSYFSTDGSEVIVFCPESKDAIATQQPLRRTLADDVTAESPLKAQPPEAQAPVEKDGLGQVSEMSAQPTVSDLKEQHFTILYGDTGHSYESILGPYLRGAKDVSIADPYIRLQHQIQNFVRFCETDNLSCCGAPV